MVDHGGSWWRLLGVLDAELHTALRRAHRIVVEVELGEEGDRAVSAPRPECDGDLDATAGEGLGAAVSDGDVGRIDDDQRLGAARRHDSRRRARHGGARRSLLQQLLLLLRQPLSSTVLMVLMNALGDLSKQRPPLLPLVVPALCELQRRVSAGALEGLQRAQLGNVQTSLKSALLALVKLPAVGAASLAAVGASPL